MKTVFRQIPLLLILQVLVLSACTPSLPTEVPTLQPTTSSTAGLAAVTLPVTAAKSAAEEPIYLTMS